MSDLRKNYTDKNVKIKKAVRNNVKNVLLPIEQRANLILKKYCDSHNVNSNHLPVDIEDIIIDQKILINETSQETLMDGLSNAHLNGYKDPILGQVSIIGFNDNNNAIIQICNNLEPKMRRFVLAHELAHIILLTEDPFTLLYQEKEFSYIFNKFVSSDEVMCDIFAGFLLLPSNIIDVVRDEYSKRNSIREADINEFFILLSQRAQIPLYAVYNCFNNYKQLELANEKDKKE